MNWVPEKEINWKRVKELISNCEKTGQFTNNGPNTILLESIIKEKLLIDKDKTVICVNNGSSALYALTSAISRTENKDIKWATQDFTFPPSAQNILKDALIIDIDNEGGLDLNLVPEDISGIIITNIFGTCVDIKKYEKWAKENNKFFIFDNAATPFSMYQGKNTCNYGQGATISFHHTKPLGFGEGGAIICDKKYEYVLRRIINFGIDNLNTEEPYWYEEGTNYKISDIQASFIIQYLDNFDKIKEKHYELSDYLLKKVKIYPNFSEKPFLSCLPIITESKEEYDKLKKTCDDNNIFNRSYYRPLRGLPKSKEFYNNILCIPLTKDIEINDYDILFN